MNNREPEATSERLFSRRGFLAWLGVSLGGLAAVLVGVPIVGAVFAPLARKRKAYWRSVGPVEKFVVGDTVEVRFANAFATPWANGFAETAAWLQRRSDDTFVAYSINCTHLGCPVRWVAESELFMCPCHGGVYYKDGSVAAGPPPRGLSTYPVRVRRGHVEIQTSPVPIT